MHYNVDEHSPLSFLVILITGCSRSILRHSSSPDSGSMVGVGAITCSIFNEQSVSVSCHNAPTKLARLL